MAGVSCNKFLTKPASDYRKPDWLLVITPQNTPGLAEGLPVGKFQGVGPVTLVDLAGMFNPHVRGWINYYGRFYPSALYPTLRRIDVFLARWADRKFKSLRRHKTRAIHWLQRIARRQTGLFAHWALLFGRGRTMGAV